MYSTWSLVYNKNNMYVKLTTIGFGVSFMISMDNMGFVLHTFLINSIDYSIDISIGFPTSELQLPMQSVPITTNVVSSNPAQARCTQCNIMS